MIGWLRRFFGSSTAPRTENEAQQSSAIEMEPFGDDDSFISIRELDFFGSASRSPDQRYVLAWSDRDQGGTRGGYRDSGYGRYLLLKNGVLTADGRAERPNDGKVANNGTFIINDWRFGEGLKGRFLACTATGEVILAREFNANLLNNGLSEDGSLAVCQTCHAEGPDNAILVVFDLVGAMELASWQAPSGWADSYRFASDGQSIELVYRDGCCARYSLTGEFLNRDEWSSERIASGNLWVIESAIKQIAQGHSAITRDVLMTGLEAAVSKAHDDRSRARALRLRGEVFEAEGQLTEALRDYEDALRNDPAVGVKRKAAALRKTLAR